MGALLSIAVELYEIDCGSCGGVYAITEKYRAHKALHGECWTCPYCKVGWGYANSGQLAKKQKELDAERVRTQAALARANEAAEQLAVAQRKLKSHATRAKNGTCPCCTRTFKQLAAHMKNKHPDYTA